jgi:hypothetical protein
MYPNLWGSESWFTLYDLAWNYYEDPTEKQMEIMTMIMNNIGPNLPCPACSYHCQKYVKENSPDVSSRENFINYIWNFHNKVNIRTGKRHYTRKEADHAHLKMLSDRKEWSVVNKASNHYHEDQEIIKNIQSQVVPKTYEFIYMIPLCIILFVLLIVLFK